MAVERTPLVERWVGSHDGYARLKHPVTHRREILLEKEQSRVQVTDELLGSGEHEVEIFWHFAEHCGVTLEGAVVRATHREVTLSMSLPDGLRCELRCGLEKPQPAGWVSRSFDAKQPTATVVMSGRITGAARFVTRLSLGFQA
jgi:hypothetical protein